MLSERGWLSRSNHGKACKHSWVGSLNLWWFLHCSFSSSAMKSVAGFLFLLSHSTQKVLIIIGHRFCEQFMILDTCKPNKECQLLLLWICCQKWKLETGCCARSSCVNTEYSYSGWKGVVLQSKAEKCQQFGRWPQGGTSTCFSSSVSLLP